MNSGGECKDCGETFDQLHPTGRCFVCADIAIKAQQFSGEEGDRVARSPGRPRIFSDEEREQRRKDYQYKYRTGMSRETYNKLIEEQHGECALCNIPGELIRAGVVQKLVCHSCKTFLRHAYTKPDILAKAQVLLAEFIPAES